MTGNRKEMCVNEPLRLSLPKMSKMHGLLHCTLLELAVL